ncbi:hypothetical protein [Methylohalobius crimeensis]|uniref:hypothetical protein n=1 Tax=Methylohalobius crimeensis TaxID=244365 RepID=UPI0003B4B25E|nr:hypothetical protein [Methylohalobius crimeensis]
MTKYFSRWLMVWLCVLTLPSLAETPLGLLEVSPPADNPQNSAKIKLGKQLFFDRRGRAFTDGHPTAHPHPPQYWINRPLYA